MPECDFLEARNTIRQEARKALEKLLTDEMRTRRRRRGQKISFAAEDHSSKARRSGTFSTGSTTPTKWKKLGL